MHLPPQSSQTRVKEAKYFADRAELVLRAATFVNDLFLCAARENGKQLWCEKTPQHLLHLDFLWELFPQSLFIHIKRDPRGVVNSLRQQRWGPNELRSACRFLQGTYKRWFKLKDTLDLKRNRYFEVKLEDFAVSPHDVLEQIALSCGLDNGFKNLPDISIDKVNYWERTMKSDEIEIVNEMLGPYIERIGYEI